MGIFEAWARRTLFRFRARLAAHQLEPRSVVVAALRELPEVREAIRRHAALRQVDAGDIAREADGYLREIVPAFNVLSYFRLAYGTGRFLINFFYHPIAHRVDATDAPPRGVGVVYLANHRSNADYVLIMVQLARVVSISYAAGEWARVWPLDRLFRTFGSYFVRRRYPNPLYHDMLGAYVRHITRQGVTQGIFPEGGLTRDGRLLAPKLGLLDHIVWTLDQPGGPEDIWLVPIGLNYDRVLEDRTLVGEWQTGRRRGAVRQLWSLSRFVFWNALRVLIRRRRSHGIAGMTFGERLSLRSWLAGNGVTSLPEEREARRPTVQALATEVMRRIGNAVPVTPVPLVAAALRDGPSHTWSESALLEAIGRWTARLRACGAVLLPPDWDARAHWAHARPLLEARGLLLPEGGHWVVAPAGQPLLAYYANSILHLTDEA